MAQFQPSPFQPSPLQERFLPLFLPFAVEFIIVMPYILIFLSGDNELFSIYVLRSLATE